jgi:hypothetical protein
MINMDLEQSGQLRQMHKGNMDFCQSEEITKLPMHTLAVG